MPAVAEPPPKACRKPKSKPCHAVIAPPGVSDAEARIRMDNVSPELYEAMLDAIGDGLPRLTYHDGHLEIEMPSDLHDELSFVSNSLITAYLEENETDFRGMGSTTWRKPEERRDGCEADESYYIQSFETVKGQRIDLSIHPPPDLAIEIDLSHPTVSKESIYAKLGVPEIWRWRDGRIAVLLRTKNGKYRKAKRSLALPDFPLDELAAELARTPHPDQPAALRDFRRRCRAAAEGRA